MAKLMKVTMQFISLSIISVFIAATGAAAVGETIDLPT